MKITHVDNSYKWIISVYEKLITLRGCTTGSYLFTHV